MTDTPETDDLARGNHVVPTEFARTLERERNDLREIFPMILVSLKSGACAATCSVDFLRKIPKEVRLVRERLERERDEAREQRDRLAEALRRVRDGYGGQIPDPDCGCEDCKFLRPIDEALQYLRQTKKYDAKDHASFYP